MAEASAPPRPRALRDALAEGGVDLPGMEESLELYRGLCPFAEEGLRPAARRRTLGAAQARARLAEGFSLLDLPSLLPDPKDLARRAGEVLDVLLRHSEPSGPSARADVLREPTLAAALASRYLEGAADALRGRAAERPGLEPDVALFVLFNSLKGTIVEAARSLGGLDTAGWERGDCPACGARPAVSYLVGEGGQRHLVCHRCQSRWRVPRLFCAGCGSTDLRDLAYFTVEGREAGPRVDHCAACSTYIKTWDLRDREGVLPEAEDLKTPAVDLAARRRGLARVGPNVFGISADLGLAEGVPAAGRA